ncbi:hypothetical protein BgiBS90_021418 [Biomphalaria glabrata]|nr:hypothetical protein BgiBS90_021418 [Biomphalaria glabrata]
MSVYLHELLLSVHCRCLILHCYRITACCLSRPPAGTTILFPIQLPVQRTKELFLALLACPLAMISSTTFGGWNQALFQCFRSLRKKPTVSPCSSEHSRS